MKFLFMRHRAEIFPHDKCLSRSTFVVEAFTDEDAIRLAQEAVAGSGDVIASSAEYSASGVGQPFFVEVRDYGIIGGGDLGMAGIHLAEQIDHFRNVILPRIRAF